MQLEKLGYQDLRSRIGTEIREIRRSKGWSQQELGEALGLSRYTIIRFESGAQDVREHHAKLIEDRTETGGLLALVKQRDTVASSRVGAPARDLVVRDLLERSGIHSVEVLLVDDLDLFDCIRGNEALRSAQIVVVIPTAARERQLFHGPLMFGHYENQMKRLSDVIKGREGPLQITVYESDKVLQPGMVVRSSSGAECAMWPALPQPDGLRGEDAPIVTSSDPGVVAHFAKHIAYAHDGRQPIQKNEALGTLDEEPAADGSRPIRFAGYVQHGGAHEDGEKRGTPVGFAVSLVLIHAIAPREGHPPKRRMILYWRENETNDDDLWSLISNRVDDQDMRDALSISDGDGRSVATAEDAAVRVSVELERHNYELPLRAYQAAARRELLTMFGIEIGTAYERLEELPLPPSLQQIDKYSEAEPLRRPILPRLFAFQLESGESGKTEFQRLRDAALETTAVGYEDLTDPEPKVQGKLNSFLVAAGEAGWLREQLIELGIAPR